MEAPEFKRLPFGYSSFATLRLRDMIYVDKTDKVVSLIDSASLPVPAGSASRFSYR